jgi:hypothetical protein
VRPHWWKPEPGEIVLVLLGAGWGLVWLLVGFTLAMTGALGTIGNSDWNVPGPALNPLGIVRTLLLLPIYAAFGTVDLLIGIGLHPGGAVLIALALLYSVGSGMAAGMALAAHLRVRG